MPHCLGVLSISPVATLTDTYSACNHRVFRKKRAHARCSPRAFSIVLMLDTFSCSDSDILRLRCKGLCQLVQSCAKQFCPGFKAFAKLLKALNCTSCAFSFIQVHGRYALKLEQWKNQLFFRTSWSKKKIGSQIFKNPNCLNVAQPSSQALRGSFPWKATRIALTVCDWFILIY